MPKNTNSTPIRYKLLEFVEEGNGSFSATRLAFLLWVVGVLAVWIIASLEKKELQSLPNDIVTILGILMTGKVVQKYGEDSGDKEGDNTTQASAEAKQLTDNQNANTAQNANGNV